MLLPVSTVIFYRGYFDETYGGRDVMKNLQIKTIQKFYVNRIAKFRKYLYCLILLTLFQALCEIIKPYIFSLFLDECLSGDKEALCLFVCVVIIVFLCNHLIDALFKYIATKYKNKIDQDLSISLLNKLLLRDIEYYEKKNQGEILQVVLNEIDTIKSLYCDVILHFVKYAFEFVFMFMVVSCFNTTILLWVSCLVPVVFCFQVLFKRRIITYQKKVRENISALSGNLNDTINGIATIKTNDLYTHRINSYSKYLQKVISSYNLILINDNIYRFVMALLMLLPVLYILFWGGREVINGGVSVGEFTMIYAYAAKLLLPISNISNLSVKYNKAFISLQRYLELYGVEPEVTQNADPEGRIESIKFENISFAYSNFPKVISNFSYEFTRGNLYYVEGANGSGKTTLFNILTGLVRKEAMLGKVIINGAYELNTLSHNYWNSHIALVPQHPFMFNDISACENVFFDFSQRDEIAEGLSGAFQVYDLLQSSRNIQRNGETLSGGQKQKLSILRALNRTADVLILDEPFKELDTQSKKALCTFISQIRENAIIIISSHEKIEYLENYITVSITGEA